MTFIELEILEQPSGVTAGMYLYLTICGYRKPGMNAEDYRNHMVNTSAPMIKGQMVKYGMGENMDSGNYSKDIEDYKRMKQDPWCKEHLVGDHEKFADTRSIMTIGWIEEIVRDRKVVDGFKDC
ncbi:unnamed protein product [Penicillium nalgiovense]|nr:unnamed protein product [Penicillium nalgiovense]